MTFRATLVILTNQLISADFNQLISYFPSDLCILDPNYNMGHFYHSILVTEPDFVIGIEKFQEFWNFLESLESLCEYLNFGLFGQIGYFFHSILGLEFDSEGSFTKFQRFCDSGIFLESLESLFEYLMMYSQFEILTK